MSDCVSRPVIFRSNEDVTIPGKGLQNLGLWTLSSDGSLSCHTSRDTGLGFLVSSEGPPHLVALYDKQGVSRTCSEPDLTEYPLSHVRPSE